jgi:hypothetical protein|tara:strand:+ start:449 stop:775 length:327 start_codon:yes stop_codon:yes gene_type:complete
MIKKRYCLPSAIKVGDIEFKIVLKKMKDYGDMDIDKKVIRIRTGLSDEESFDTLMHEVVHASLAISGLSNILDDSNIEEAIVRVADYILFPVYKREYGNYRRKTDKEV